MSYLMVCLLCYLVGGIPTGYLLGKALKGEDIRKYGSGNIGATNAFRILGAHVGLLTLFGDMLKGFLAVYLTRRIFQVDALTALALVAVVLGHCYSPYLHFHGGKGVATVSGALLGVVPVFLLLCAPVFFTIAILSRYVSLASILTMFTGGYFSFFLLDAPLEIRLAIVFVASVSILRHRSNLERLLAGTESKFQGKQHG